MGVVVPLFQTMVIENDTVTLALRDIPKHSMFRSEFTKRLNAILHHPRCPELVLSHDELMRLHVLFDQLDCDPYRRQEAYLASLFRMGEVVGWNPNSTWPLRAQKIPLEARLMLEACYGMIALIWQVKYCRELALCFEDNRRLIPH